MSVRKPSLTCNFPENHAALSLFQPNSSAFQKHELNNSLLQGPQERVNVKTGQFLITMDGSEFLGDEYYLMAHGKNSKPLKTKCEKRHLAPASGRCSLPRCRRKCKHKAHVSYGPRLPPHIAACSHDAAAILAPAHCSSLPTRCRAPNMATNLGPICARRSNVGSWPQLHQNTAEAASLRRHTHITAPLSNAMHCARAPCTSKASYAELRGVGGGRCAHGSGRSPPRCHALPGSGDSVCGHAWAQ